jgi:hypothetical protein
MLQFAQEAKMDEHWAVDRSWEGTLKTAPIVVAKRNEEKQVR